MTDEKKSAPAQGESASKTVCKFPLDRLRVDCFQLFGVTASTFDGATRKLKGDVTVEAVKAAINSFQDAKLPQKTKKKEGK